MSACMLRRLLRADDSAFGRPQDTHSHEAPGSPRGRAARSIAPRQPNGRWYVQATSRSYRDRSIPARHVSRPPARKQRRVIRQPAVQRSPLAQQCLVRRLDGQFACFLGNIGDQKALLDEVGNEGPRSFGDFRQPGDAAARRNGIRIDASEPRNKSAAEQRGPAAGTSELSDRRRRFAKRAQPRLQSIP